MEPKYEINHQLTYDIYKEYTDFHYKRVQKANNWYLFQAISIFIFSLLLLWLYNRSKDSDYLIILAFLISCTIIFNAIKAVKRKILIKKSWESNKFMDETSTINLKLFDDHFEQTSSIGYINLPYDKLFGAYETDAYFYLMISKGQGVVIPKLKCSGECVAFLQKTLPLK